MPSLYLLLLIAGLEAGEVVGCLGPAPELPIAVVIRGGGLVDGAGLVWQPGDAKTVEVAVAIGAFPELRAGPLPLDHLAGIWQPAPPVHGERVALVVVGPAIEPDREQSRIESVRQSTDSIEVVLGRWSDPHVRRDAAPRPMRQVWLLSLPPQPAGRGQVVVQQQWHQRDGATGRVRMVGFASGTVVGFTVGAGAAGGRAAARLAPVEGWSPQRDAIAEWLPAAQSWTHTPLAPGILAGTGLLGWRQVDVAAASAVFDQPDLQPEAVLARGRNQAPCVLVNGPQLNSGEYCSIRSAAWTGNDTLDVQLVVWRDNLGRKQNLLHQETWLLPIHPQAIPQAGPPRLHLRLGWEHRLLDQASGWYRYELRPAHPMPAGTVTDLAVPEMPAQVAGRPASGDF